MFMRVAAMKHSALRGGNHELPGGCLATANQILSGGDPQSKRLRQQLPDFLPRQRLGELLLAARSLSENDSVTMIL